MQMKLFIENYALVYTPLIIKKNISTSAKATHITIIVKERNQKKLNILHNNEVQRYKYKI